jgi:hypothetical protein
MTQKESLKEIAQRTATWTLRKYGLKKGHSTVVRGGMEDALYMLFHTHEVTEGYLGSNYPDMTEVDMKKVIEMAGVIMSKRKLSETQAKLLSRLQSEVLYRTRLGPFTGSFRFKGKKEKGVNSTTIDKLRLLKLVEVTDKMTMYGLTEYCHLPGMRPWKDDPSWLEYMRRH